MFRIVGQKLYFRHKIVAEIKADIWATAAQDLEHELVNHTPVSDVERLKARVQTLEVNQKEPLNIDDYLGGST